MRCPPLIPGLGEVSSLISVLGEASSVLGEVSSVLGEVSSLIPVLGEVSSLIPVLGEASSVLGEVSSLIPVLGEVSSLIPVLGEVSSLIPGLGEVSSLIPCCSLLLSQLPLYFYTMMLVSNIAVDVSIDLGSVTPGMGTSIQEGENITYNCSVGDISDRLLPDLKLTWVFNDDMELASSVGLSFLELTLTGVNASNSGNYSCLSELASGLLSNDSSSVVSVTLAVQQSKASFTYS